MEPKHKYTCHLVATPPQDASLQFEGDMWVDVYARDFDHARSELAAWQVQMQMGTGMWAIVSIEQQNGKE